MSIERREFGSLPDGGSASLFSLIVDRYCVEVTDWGATLVSFKVPESKGGLVDIVLGFDSVSGYWGTKPSPCFGSTIGRCANRIAQAAFMLDGRQHILAANEGSNHLHGGLSGFDSRLWAAQADDFHGEPCLRLFLTSPDGDQGYPGRLDVETSYRLQRSGKLIIEYHAHCSSTTIVNLTNHAYFNLCGAGNGTILDHELTIAASQYIPVDLQGIPLGHLARVEGSAFDFRKSRTISQANDLVGGYDHCFALDPIVANTGRPLAELHEPNSHRRLEVSTSMPGIQFYAGRHIGHIVGKQAAQYGPYSGLCLEAQFFPNSPNVAEFPSVVLAADQTWNHTISYQALPGTI